MKWILSLVLLALAGTALAYNPFMPQGSKYLADMDQVFMFQLVGTPATGTIYCLRASGDTLTVPQVMNEGIIEWVQKRTIENRETSEWVSLGPKKAMNIVAAGELDFRTTGQVTAHPPFGTVVFTDAENDSIRAKPWILNLLLTD